MSTSSSNESIVDYYARENNKIGKIIERNRLSIRIKNFLNISREVFQNIPQQYAENEIFKYQSGAYRKVLAQQQPIMFLWFSGHATVSFANIAARFHIFKGTLSNVIDRLTRCFSGVAGQIIMWCFPQEKRNIEVHSIQNGTQM